MAQAVAVSRNGVCLSDHYVNGKTLLTWRCAQGHTWRAHLENVKNNGSWCPSCANRVPLTIEDARIVATSRGGVCLSEHIAGKIHWRCSGGHEWFSNLRSVKSGKWCRKCSGSQKYTIEDLRKIARDRGGIVLSTTTTGRLLSWKCAEGHIWHARPRNIVRGSWCTYCSGVGEVSLEDMQAIAVKRGGLCLSEEYSNQKIKLQWQCSEGHTWWAASSHIRNSKSWCPECKAFKNERECRKLFETLLNEYFPKSRPEWLRNSRGNKMELDGYSRPLAIAFEYQGYQHYEECHLHKTPDAFAWQQQRDAEKRALCKVHGVTLIEIPWTTKDIEAFVREQLAELGLGPVAKAS